jgi:4-hydroxy-tetrahydrodipicolinate reductase
MREAPIRIALCGAAGRMGSEVARAIGDTPGLKLTLAIERAGHAWLGREIKGVVLTTDLAAGLSACDVIVDFTLPEGTVACARAAAGAKLPLVSGVTGLSDDQLTELRAAAEQVAVVHAPNMSLGVAALDHLLREAGRMLPATYDIEIVETHHRRKQDSPSGTALRWAHLLERVRPGLTTTVGRARGASPPRGDGITIHSVRGGDVVGEHQVIFAGPGERVVLAHHAESRGAFVAGVLAAVRFVRRRPAGLYSMADVLGLPTEGPR